MLPQMREFILWRAAIEIHSNQAERFRRVGLPSRVVPIYNTPLGVMTQNTPPRLMLTDWLNCCASLRTLPLIEHARGRGVTLSRVQAMISVVRIRTERAGRRWSRA